MFSFVCCFVCFVFLSLFVCGWFVCCVVVVCLGMGVSSALFSLRCFNILCYASGFYILLFFRQMLLTRARARVCVCCSLALYSAVEHV